MEKVIHLARETGTRPIFTRVESPGQRNYLQTLPEVLLQGWAIGWPTANPARPA